MNCIEFEAAIEHAVEVRQRLPSVSLEHTASCADCQALLERHRQLDTAIVAWRASKPRPGLADAVLAELALPVRLGDRDAMEDLKNYNDFSSVEAVFEPRSVSVQIDSRAKRKARPAQLAMVSVAACLFAAVVFVTRYAGRNHQNGHEMTRISPVQVREFAVVDQPPDVSGTLTAVFSDLRSEYREMASETSAVAREMVNAIPHRVSVSALPDPDEIRLHSSSNEMGSIWKPIGNRVESALGFLWQAIPSEVPSS